MSVINDFFTSNYTAYKDNILDPQSTSTSSVVATGKGLLRPITDRNNLFDQNNFGKEYAFLIPSSDTPEGATTIDIDSKSYGVSTITNYTDLEPGSSDESHKELRVYYKN